MIEALAVDLICDRHYCRIQNMVEKGTAERQAASHYLKQLTDIGVLEERAIGDMLRKV